MIDRTSKNYLIEREKKSAREKLRWPLRLITLCQILTVIPIWREARQVVRTLIHSFRYPSYTRLILTAVLCIALASALGILKRKLLAKSLGEIALLETAENEDAVIDRGILTLSADTKKGRVELPFDLRYITKLETCDAKTSFTYIDPSGGKTKFSCLDYYNPPLWQILKEALEEKNELGEML